EGAVAVLAQAPEAIADTFLLPGLGRRIGQAGLLLADLALIVPGAVLGRGLVRAGLAKAALASGDQPAIGEALKEAALQPGRAGVGVGAALPGLLEAPAGGAEQGQALAASPVVGGRVGDDAVLGAGLGVVVQPGALEARGAVGAP